MKLNKTLLIAALSLLAASGLMAKENAKKEEIPGVAAQPASFFYTGKPYDVDLGNYIFAARNYDPSMSRWASADPSGFPDGANNRIYAPTPTSAVDPDGQKQVASYKSWIKTSTHDCSYLSGGLLGGAAGGATLVGIGSATLASGGAALLIGGATAAGTVAAQYESWASGIDQTYSVGGTTTGDYISYVGMIDVADDWVCKSPNPSQIISAVSKDWSLGWTCATFTAKIYSTQTFQWGPE